MMHFRLQLLLIASLLSSSSISQAAQGTSVHQGIHSFLVTATNPANVSRPQEVISLDLQRVKAKHPSFNPMAFEITCAGKIVPTQMDTDPISGSLTRIIALVSFVRKEKKRLEVSWIPDTVINREFPKLTQAALGMKVGYKKVNGFYTGGRFVDDAATTMPHAHSAHDALYRIEGPGWESDKIAYRYYLDSRNRNDIFGKKKAELVLQKLGVNDLVSNSMESYTKMLDWGMDIFKVGESLGIGSIAIWHDSKVVTVSDVRTVKCYVAENGSILSGIYTLYLGWKVGKADYDLYSHLTISAGSRLTGVDLTLKGKQVDLCTGLAKHEDCDFIRTPSTQRGRWAYIALYGKQSLSDDDLGIAVFYRSADRVKVTEDSLSDIVILRPQEGQLTYYFGAAWQQEPGGIKNENEFKAYLERTLVRLDNPIEVEL